jgi:hypothetical protein
LWLALVKLRFTSVQFYFSLLKLFYSTLQANA